MGLIIKRLLANFVDIFLFFAIIAMYFSFLFPLMPGSEGESFLLAGLSLLFIVAAYFAVQYPFLKVHQTVGKAFFGLKIISTNEQRPLTVSVIVAREVFAKVMTCYLMCLPVLFKGRGKHDEACETDVI